MQRLEAHEVPLHKVFCGDYDFRIPEYQRPYAWEADQAEQLVEDLAEALERGGDEPYFLGSIVLIKQQGDPRAEVIDGQQRLTTLTVLLAVLRDLTVNQALADELDKMIVEPGAIVLGREAKPRLELRPRDKMFFHRYVQKRGATAGLLALKPDTLKTDAQRAVQTNTRALHDKMSRWPEDQRLALAQLLGERTFLVVVSTPDLESAHRIFSVMNARGLDLSPADIFKATIIGAVGDASGSCAVQWENAEEALGREDFADLFTHIRMIYAKEKAKRELLKEFPDQVLNRFLPSRGEAFVTDELVPYADAYAQIRGQSYAATSGAERVNAWFRRLSQLDNSDWRPPALWAVRHHGDDPVWLDEFLRRLERLATSMFVRRIYATPRIARYAELLRELTDRGHGLDAPSFLLTDSEKAETLTRLNGDIYLVEKVRRYVLLRLDEALANNPGVTYDYPVITVEHVLPQNPGVGAHWLHAFNDAERELWTHRIANLVLLNRAKNSQAQNFDFPEKKARYFSGRTGVAPFALTVQVLSLPEWTPAVLESRQKDLLAVLANEWEL